MGGDFKVRCNKSDSSWLTKGKIYEVKNGAFPFDNGFSSYHGFESFSDFCKRNPSMGKKLELIEDNQSIFITRNGNETISVLKNGKETAKIAKAKCSPSDAFSFEIGAKLALERLFETDKLIIKEVKRIARAGEYIKVVKEGKHLPHLVIGDIHKVTEINVNGDIFTDKANFFHSKEHGEYVVLENCQPCTVTEEKSEPKTLTDYTKSELLEELLRREK